MKETNHILWENSGPRLEMTNRGPSIRQENRFCLNIQDTYAGGANINWCFSRWEMVKVGLWFIRRALFARPADD